MPGYKTDSAVAQFLKTYDAARPDQRLDQRPEFERVLNMLILRNEPVPSRMRQIERELEDAAFEDLIENMPV